MAKNFLKGKNASAMQLIHKKMKKAGGIPLKRSVEVLTTDIGNLLELS